MVYNALRGLLSALLPPSCLLCQAPATGPNHDLCAGCERDLPRIAWPCPRCALPLPAASADFTCGACLHAPPAWDRCTSALAYAAPVSQLIPAWKQRGLHPAGPAFTRLLAERLDRQLPLRGKPATLLPVPQHWRRTLVRGFHPAASIARHLGRELGIPVDTGCLRRLHHSPQQGLNARERRRNLKGAFAVTGPLPAHVALVDDVVTTGSTATALCTLLRQHGAERIEMWCLARTPKATA